MQSKSRKDDLELPLIAKRSIGSSKEKGQERVSEIRKSSASQPEKQKYFENNPISRLLFLWIDTIMKKTGDNPFQQNMHYGLRITEDCGWIAAKFISEWENAKKKSFAFLRTQYNSFTFLIWITQILAFIITLLSFTGPILVSQIITYTESFDPEFSDGVNLVLLFILSRVCVIVVSAQSASLQNLLLVRIVKATRSLIFTKFLKFPLKRSQDYSTGSVMNHMLVDAENMSKIFTLLPQIIQLPIMLIIAVYLVYISIGFAFLGVAITIVVIALTMSFLTKQTNKYQKEIMTTKDVRVKRTTEIFNGIKYIKMCGSEPKFMEIIANDRENELSLLKKRYNIACFRLLLTWLTPTFLNLSAFGAYLLSGEELTPQKAFVVVSTLMVVQGPIFGLGNLLNEISQSKVSLDRIQKFLYAEEVSTDYIFRTHNSHEQNAIRIVNGNFAWIDEATQAKANQKKEAGPKGGNPPGKEAADKKKEADLERGPNAPPSKLVLVLKDINIQIKKGSFVAILGDVGSGKSSLFHALFGEMMHQPEDPPSVYIDGSVAYVSQKPWVLNDTVKENILFDRAYDEEAYKEALRGSCLEQDLKTLIKKDETEIGEKGVNLSGGQKARIALARAIYSDKDIYLLDDPLSAVDAHVGKYILEECLVGQLGRKTRVLVTHKIESLRYVDYVYIFKGGEIVAQGDRNTIRDTPQFREIEEKSSKKVESKDEQASPKKVEKADPQAVKKAVVQSEKPQGPQDPARKRTSVYEKEDQKQLYDKLMISEDRKIGAVGMDTWKSFFAYFGSKGFFALLLTIIITWIILRTASDFWLAYWSSQGLVEAELDNSYYYGIYAILGITSGTLVYVRIRMVFFRNLEVNRKLHNEMFYKVIRAPVNLFFDRVPLGRLVNRFTADLNSFDFMVPFSLGTVLYLPFNLLSRFLVCGFGGTLWVFPLTFLFFFIGIKIQRKYLGLYREVFRLSRITATPVTSLFTESLDGLTHIRSANYEDAFMRKYYNRQNENMKNEILVSTLQGWFSFRINLASFIIIGPTITAAVLFIDHTEENAGLIGLLITYLLDLNQNLIMTLQMASSFESNLISFERCKAFTTIDVEKDPDTKLPLANYSYSWPQEGTIELKNYYVKYRPTLPYVLKDVSLKIHGGEKIGVVGRTGSGKSTLFLSILRILEAQSGQLFIDDVNIADVGLDDLRKKITIIPQDPLLYKGTVRSNMDLLNEYTDEEIWSALDKVRMKNKFEQSGLKSDIKEGGENLSAGEKQLLCIGRAILKKNKIVLIDEATSSIDNVTEEAILEAIHENFKACTVITIAHRLKTIISSDKVLFMADGQVMEFDTPSNLLQHENGHFYQLWHEYENAHS